MQALNNPLLLREIIGKFGKYIRNNFEKKLCRTWVSINEEKHRYIYTYKHIYKHIKN